MRIDVEDLSGPSDDEDSTGGILAHLNALRANGKLGDIVVVAEVGRGDLAVMWSSNLSPVEVAGRLSLAQHEVWSSEIEDGE